MLRNRNVHVPTGWLDSVLQAFNAYSANCSINCNHIYQKWLNSDLQSIGYDFAPYPQITCPLGTVQTVQGPLVMQILNAKDVAQPPLPEDDDALVDAEREAENAELTQASVQSQAMQSNRPATTNGNANNRFGKKATRYLSIELFDGFCGHRAFEFQMLPTINLEQLKPGTKVMLKGSIEMASGVFLLKHNNLEVLGGRA